MNMPKYNRNSGKRWSVADEKKLSQYADSNMPTRVIGLKLGRTPDAVYKKAGELGVSLDPANQSPYG